MNPSLARIASFLVLAGAALALPAAAEDLGRVPAPFDWSHRHSVYSKPATPTEAIRAGTFEQWRKDYRDPRFVLALQRRLEWEADQKAQAPATPVAKAARAPVLEGASPVPSRRLPTEYPVSPRVSPPHRDWNIAMGAAAGVGSPGIFPAKYNFDISAAPSCTNDFVVYPTSAAGVTGSGVKASRTGTVTGSVGTGNTVTITNGTRSLVLTSTASGGTNTGLNFANTAPSATRAANLAAAINRNGALVGVTATSAAAVVTVTAMAHGTGGNAITLAETLGAFTWAGGTLAGGSGTAGQPTIFAVNQLYLACRTNTAGNPMALWSYNTGTGVIVDSSPIISLDGTQVAFIARSGAVASLVMLKWAASTGNVGDPVAPTSVAAGSYRGCTAPCMTSITLNGSPNNTNSSPYYYYDTDELWVGDNAGVLHKFTNIFLSGTPTEVTTGGWPVTVDAGFTLSSPVYDRVSNLVYVGTNRTPDAPAGTPHGGRLHSVNNSTVAVLASAQLAGVVAATNSGSVGVAEAVIVDQLARRVYAFVATDTTSAASPCNNNSANVECHAVYQFDGDASISGITGLAKATFGRGQIFTRIGYAGVFDNAYYTSADPASPSGFLYVCGSSAGGASSRQPSLWRIQITNNSMNTTAVFGQQLVSGDTADGSGGGGSCSPITDVQNGANNYIYVSVPELGNRTGCAGACIYVYNLTGITWGTTNATAGLAAPGGTSGIVIDNISATSGASQIYYSTMTSPGGAIQASQAALN